MLFLGTKKIKHFLNFLHDKDEYLLVDGGDIIDALPFPTKRKDKSYFPQITLFDISKHAFNPLDDINKRRARQHAEIIYGPSHQGENTLTVRNGKRALRQLLLRADHLNRLPVPESDAEIEACAAVDDILFSDFLPKVLTRSTNFSMEGIVLVRLDPAILSTDERFVLANFLITKYPGTIVIPDYADYACPFHIEFLRQDRLVVGLNFLGEVPEKLRNLLILGDVVRGKCLPQDKEILAQIAGHAKGSQGFKDF